MFFFFFLNFHFAQGSPKMAELIRIPWLCGLSVPQDPRRGGSGLGGVRRGSLWDTLECPGPRDSLQSPGASSRSSPGPPPCAGQVAARWPRGRGAAPPRGACAWGAWGGRAGAGATSPGLSTSRRRPSRCRLRAGLSGSPARGAWPVRGRGSSRWGVAGRVGKATRRPGPWPGESWANRRVARGAARRRVRRPR